MKHTYQAAVVLVAILLPIPMLATFITATLYVTMAQQFISPPVWLNWTALLAGMGSTTIIWLAAALFFRSSTTAQHANELSYDAIIQELRRLEMNFETIEVNDSAEVVELAERAYVALYGEEESDSIKECLKVNGIQWARGTGYIDIWKRLQTADAEMIALLPVELVLGGTDYDLLRLEGSTIPDRQHWIDTMKQAKVTLERVDKQKKANKTQEDHTQQGAEEQQLLGQALLDLLKTTVTAPNLPLLDEDDIPENFGSALFALIQRAVSPAPQSEAMQDQARADLRRARIAINNYITNRWIELIQFRDRLLGAAFVTSIFVYALFVIAIIDNAPASSLIAAFAFYFIGAIVGLYVCLASKPKDQNAHSHLSSSSINSLFSSAYRLTLVRIIVTPLFSGLAALIGVGLAVILSISLVTLAASPSNTPATAPSPTAIVATVTPTTSPAAPPGERIVPNYPALDQIYSLPNNVKGVIFALIFGLLASLVISAMQEAAVSRSQIRSTDPDR